MMSRALSVLLLLSFLPALGTSVDAAGSPPVIAEFDKYLVIDRVGEGGRRPVHTDAIERSIVDGSWRTPEPGDAVMVEGIPRIWQGRTAGKNGWLEDEMLRGGYALAIIEREEAGPGSGVARAFLNLGHTFAHAIEPLPELGLKHGEAVAIGLMAAGACARSLGHWGVAESEALQATLEACGLPIALPEPVKQDRLIERMGWDKKVRQGTLTIVVPDGRGSVSMLRGPSRDLLEAGWSAVGAR